METSPSFPAFDPKLLSSLGPSLFGLGTDLVYLPRIEQLYCKYGNRFLDRILTPHEKAYCIKPVSLKVKVARIGGRIAVKEAVVKLLGIGIASMGNPQGTLWTHVEILREERHAPRIKLHQKAAEIANNLGVDDWLVSLTHDGDYALAVLMGLKRSSVAPGAVISL